jgi:diaminopimelate epimerase
MRLAFTKMHGCGNDYIFLDALAGKVPGPRLLPALAQRLSDRHRGIGGDGLVVLAPSRRADLRMAMFNADGSASEMCGNAIRCLAKLAYERGHVRSTAITVETGAGVLTVELLRRGRRVTGASVAMGRPRLTPEEVPVKLASAGPLLRLTVAAVGREVPLVAVGMGNPHAVAFVRDPDAFPVAAVGPAIERHPRFPRRTNVEFVAVQGRAGGLPCLRQRTWERGSGETLACGTGACAATVAAILTGRIRGRAATVRLTGGDLDIAWPDDGAEVRMRGPAETAFSGIWEG